MNNFTDALKKVGAVAWDLAKDYGIPVAGAIIGVLVDKKVRAEDREIVTQKVLEEMAKTAKAD